MSVRGVDGIPSPTARMSTEIDARCSISQSKMSPAVVTRPWLSIAKLEAKNEFAEIWYVRTLTDCGVVALTVVTRVPMNVFSGSVTVCGDAKVNVGSWQLG
jgi:hypothetical protein